MKLNKCALLCVLICLIFCNILSAQEKQPLTTLMSQLENKFDVKFSFAANDVKTVLVNKPNDKDTLRRIIENLNATTVLNFKFLNERYITVSTIDKTITVCGILISDTDKQPLLGASVLLANSTKGVITDEQGMFKLSEAPIDNAVIISFLGFKTQSIKVKDLMFLNEDCTVVIMKAKNEALNEILISKFLTTGLQKKIDGSTILNTDQFGILPGLTEPDILQSIQALPGVESVDESIANINVRGGTNDQNLILWDNIKMYHSGHFFGLISAYNPYLTNKVEVTKNGTSSEFSDGVSSTVNMSTKDIINDNFAGGFGANLIHTDAFFEIPLSEKLAIHISGRRSFTDVFSSPTYNNYFERSFQDSEIATRSSSINDSNSFSDFFFYDYTAKVLLDFNKNHKFRANVIGINNNLDYTESFTTDTNNETQSKTSNLKQKNLGFGVSWNGQWTDKFTTNFSAFYSSYNVDATDFRIETDQELEQKNEVLETGLKIKSNLKLNQNLSILGGYQFSETGILNSTEVSAPAFDKTKKDVLLNHAIYGEVEFKKNNTYLRAGVRGNYFQKFNRLIVEPRLNIRQKLSRKFAIKLQGEFKNQSATQIIDFQDDFLGVENRRWVLANNSTIPISKSKQVSFGFEFNRNNLVIDIEGYYKVVNGITVLNQGFYNNFQFLNATGSYDAKGVEFLINKTSNTFSTWLSYTYSINNYEFKTLAPPVFPNNADIRHSVSAALNYNVTKNLEVSLGGIWRTGRPFTTPVENNETVESGNTTLVNYDTPNSQNLDDFIRFDTSLNYSFKITRKLKSSLRAGVINVLNRKNILNTYYEVNPEDSNTVIQIDNLSLGVTPNLSFRCSF